MSGVAPTWFLDALAVEVECGQVEVAGCSIHYRAWGPPSQDGVVLVHGGAAHSRWWDHIAPLLARDRRVVALDTSGHGDSGRRQKYDLGLWAEEILAVARAAGLQAPPVVVGHSMGGMVTLVAARLFGSELAGAIVVDTPVHDMTPEEYAARIRIAFGPLRVYPTRADAMSHFRLVPPQGGVLPYVSTLIAETSVRQVEGGWTWKFDPVVFGRDGLLPDQLSRPDCRVALFYAEHGLTTAAMQDMIFDRLGRAAPKVEIPAAAHHVMIDQPLALVTGIRTILADWRHSVPHR